MSLFRRTIVICATLIIILAIYSIIVEPNFMIRTNVISLKFKKLPKAFDGYKIVQISDLHFGIFHLPIRNDLVINIISKIRPNLIVITGDLVSNIGSAKDVIRFIKRLTFISNVVIVFGNWDHISGFTSYKETLQKLSKVFVLENSHIVVTKNDERIYIIGVDDPHLGFDNLTKALSKVPNQAFKILLAHSPQIIDKAKGKVDLILTGHTHGGQVVIPLIGPLFVPLPSKYRRYVAGLFEIQGTYLYVNRGIGTSILPIRFNCPPEITVIILRKA